MSSEFSEDRFSEDIERLRGFMGSTDRYDEATAVLFGVPMDFTTSFRPGTRLGPARIREVSSGIEEYSFHQRLDLKDRAFYDLGDVAVSFGNVIGSLERAGSVAAGILADGKIPMGLGGEHLISYPLIREAAKRHPGLIILHFDAHADLREDYLGEMYSHATVMRRVVEIVGPQNLYQFGIRSGTREEHEFARSFCHLYQDDVHPGLREVIPEILGRPVYVSIDIDVVDPAYAPGTGTPEPGGVTARDMLTAIRMMRDLRVVGFDLVEVSPALDETDRTAVLAAKLVREAILAFGGNPP